MQEIFRNVIPLMTDVWCSYFSLYRGENPTAMVEHEATTSKIEKINFFIRKEVSLKKKSLV